MAAQNQMLGTGPSASPAMAMNQYGPLPSMGSGSDLSMVPYNFGGTGLIPPNNTQTSTPPGIVPGQAPNNGYPYYANNLNGAAGSVGAADKLPGGAGTSPSLDPQFTQALDQFLRGQLGNGISPFNLSSFLPSTGGNTSPGQVAAPLNPMLQQLMQFLSTGSGGGAGSSQLMGLASNPMASFGTMGTTGNPTDVMPEWQSMINAQQTNIGQNQANLKEQFGSMGNLSSSSAANAMALYNTQTTADQNSLLGQLTSQSTESAQGRLLQALMSGQSTQNSAASTLFGAGNQLGNTLQSLDQNSINQLMQEYFQTTPQANPLNNEMFGLGTTFAPMYSPKGGVGSGLVGALPAIAGAAGGAADAGGGIIDTLLGALGGI